MMFSNEAKAIRLVGALYQSAVRPEQWKEFLSEAAGQAGSDSAILTVHDDRLVNWSLQESWGLPDRAMQEYNEQYGALNPAIEPLFRVARRTGSWHGLSRSLVNEDEYKQSQYYNEFGRRYGSYWGVMGTVFQAPHATITLSLVRSENEEPLGEPAVELMRMLMPHLASVMKIRSMVEAQRSISDAAVAAVEALEATMLAVDEKGRVVLASGSAEELLTERDGLQLSRGRLLAANTNEAPRLEKLIQSAANTGAGKGTQPGGSMLIHRRDRRPLQVSVSPFHPSDSLAGTVACAVIFVSDPERKPASRATVLASLYQLTPAECRFADMLLGGLELAAIAENLRITNETARFVLKSIFRKTGTHRQSELVGLLFRLPATGEH